MDDLWVLVYFPRSKNVDVLHAESVQGDIVVGENRRVKWHNKMYSAKIVYIGSKLQCEQKAPQVTQDGALEDYPFEVDERSNLSSCSGDVNETCGCCKQCKDAMNRKLEAMNLKLDEALERMKYLETHTATICFERETGVALEKQHDDISEIKTLVRKLYTIAPRPETYGINFSIMPREKVARLKTLHGKDMKGFELHLEKLLYESHLDDLIKTVDKRLETVDLVEFIKQGSSLSIAAGPSGMLAACQLPFDR
ncbi:hypothetical protein Q1695_006180 [Nippostrongylus brasiliensis]|nr:hypothetical protein Q1695_006180 [Nippostrongylus brasiliensis]